MSEPMTEERWQEIRFTNLDVAGPIADELRDEVGRLRRYEAEARRIDAIQAKEIRRLRTELAAARAALKEKGHGNS